MGVHYRWEIPEVLREQLRLAHALREDLVSLQRDYEAAINGVWSSFPQIADLEQRLSTAELEAAEPAVATDRLVAARNAVKRLRRARREAINAVRGRASLRIGEAGDALRNAQKKLYAQYCQDGDLGWHTFNDVVAQHKAAVKRIKQSRAAGHPARLQHHRFDGTGTIAVQLQRRAGQPPRTPAVLADPAGKYHNVLLLPWIAPDHWAQMSRAERRRCGRSTVRMRCGSLNGTPTWIEFPVQQHRMLAPDADITGARLTITRTAGHLRARLAVSAKTPDRIATDAGPTIAIHLGWFDTDTGTRVATWRSTSPLDIPTDLRAEITTDADATTGTVVMPHRIADRLAGIDGLRSRRDRAVAVIRDKLAAWLAEHGPVRHPMRPQTTVDADDVTDWRSPARFAALAAAWRRDPPVGGHDIAAALEAWRRGDRALWEQQEHGRKKTLRHREDLYRKIAAAITGQAGRIVVDDSSVSEIAARPSDLPADVAARIAHRRTVSAPGSLRAGISAAATRQGRPVTAVPAAGLSRTHAGCGHENPADDRYLSRPVTCDGCGATYDPDASATLLMLQRFSLCQRGGIVAATSPR